MRTNSKWLNTKEAAEQLGITTSTLYRLIDEGQLPAYKFGRVIRLKATEVTEFERSTQIKPGGLKHLLPDASEREQPNDEGGGDDS